MIRGLFNGFGDDLVFVAATDFDNFLEGFLFTEPDDFTQAVVVIGHLADFTLL